MDDPVADGINLAIGMAVSMPNSWLVSVVRKPIQI